MTDDPVNHEGAADAAVPHAVVQQKANFSVVWLIPGIMFIYLLNDTASVDSPGPIPAEAPGAQTD